MNKDELVSIIQLVFTGVVVVVICIVAFVVTLHPNISNLSKIYDIYSVILPFNIAKKCIDKESGNEIYTFNNRVVNTNNPKQKKVLKISLFALFWYAFFCTIIVLWIEAYEEAYECPFQTAFEDSGWSCTFLNNGTEFNCGNYIKNVMNNQSTNSPKTTPLQVICRRLNYNIPTALAIALVSYNLLFIAFLILEKFYSFLVRKRSRKIAVFVFSFLFLILTGCLSLVSLFTGTKYTSDMYKYWYPFLIAIFLPFYTSQVGEGKVDEVVVHTEEASGSSQYVTTNI